jgi:hypothetical protein
VVTLKAWVLPAPEHLAQVLEERSWTARGASPGHDPVELVVLGVERDVHRVWGDHAVDDVGVEQVLEPFADDFDRAGGVVAHRFSLLDQALA